MKHYVAVILSIFLYSISLASPPTGNTLNMTGSTDHILVPDHPAWDLPGDFTLSVKVKFAVQKWHMLMAHHDGTGTQGFEFSYTGSTLLLSPNGFQVCINAPWVANLNQWYTLSVARQGNTFNAYVDGALIGTSTFSGTIGTDDVPLMIGNYYVPGYHFSGEMDDVSIWSAAISAVEMQNVVAGTLSGTEPSLVALYDMNTTGQGSGLTVANQSSTGAVFNGTTLGTSTSPHFTVAAVPAGALNFDGVDDFVKVDDNPLLDFGSNDFSVEFRVLKKSTSTFWNGTVAGKWNTGASPGTNEWAISLNNNAAGDIPSFSIEVGNTLHVLSSTESIVVGAWTHVAGVRQGDSIKILINGQPKGSLYIGGGAIINNVGRDLLFGKILAGFNSPIIIDELRIWGRAICADEIQQRGDCELIGAEPALVAYYKFNQGFQGTLNSGVATLVDATANHLDGALHNFSLSGTSSNWVAGNVAGPCSAVVSTCPPTATEIFSPDLWLRADAGVSISGASVAWQDQSGNNRDASGSGNIQHVQNVYNGKPVVRFTGSTGMATSAFQTFPAKRGTIFVVSKTNGPGALSGVGYGTLVSTYFGAGTAWQFGATPTWFGYYDGAAVANVVAGSADPGVFGISTLLRDDNTSLKFLRDGTLNNTISIADNQPSVNTMKIGWNGSAEILNGDIAEIIVYGRALTSSEIAAVNQYLAGKYNLSIATTAPTVSLDKPALDYGNIGLGFSLQDSVVVTNTGTAALNISSIVSSNTDYSILYYKANLAPGDSTHVKIRYQPAAAGASSAAITISHNGPGGSTAVSLSGNATATGFSYNVHFLPGFTGNLHGATWFNSQKGFVSGGNGKIYRTNDGGATWTLVPFGGSSLSLYSIRLIGSAIWLFGSNGHICVSHNDGQTWTSFNTGTSVSFYDAYFVNAYYGFAVGGNGTICRYNGTGWQPYSFPFSNNFYGVYAYGRSAWAVGSGGIVCRYNYGTDSWSPVNPGVPNDIYGIGFWDENIGYIVGSGGLIYKTMDGCTSWIPCTSGVSANIRSIKCFSATVAWAVCEDGIVLQTTDGGTTWVKLPLGGFKFQRVEFNGCSGIAICGNGAVVTFQTSLCNSGYNPYYVRRGTGTPYGLHSSFFTGRYHGGIAGRFGSVFITTNGGQGWTSSNTGTLSDINCIRFSGNSSFICGSNGYIARCNSGGFNWFVFPGIPSGITFYSMSFYRNGTGWAVGSGGTICYYNGTGWVPYNTGVTNTFRCVYVIGDVAYAVGTNGIIFRYNGSAWVDVSPGVTNDFYACVFVNPNLGYAVGANGIICKTINGGQSWIPISGPCGCHLYCVEVGCLNEVMIAGADGNAFQSLDGGSTWTARDLGRTTDIHEISLVDGAGFIVGEEGEAYSFDFGSDTLTATITASGATAFCEGGSVTLTAAGGNNYSWSTGSVTSSVNAATAGVYTVTVSDARGCEATASDTITVYPNPTVSGTTADALCYGASTGGIELTVQSGTPGYNFNWNDGSYSTEDLQNIAAGKYKVLVNDANGCSASDSFVVDEPTQLSASISMTPLFPVAGQNAYTIYKGYGAQLVTLAANPAGGTPGYSYSWSPLVSSADTITVSPAITTAYTVTITDMNGCSVQKSITVNVIDAGCGNVHHPKVVVCHIPPANPANLHNICVDDNAVPAHLAHGDYLGPCRNIYARMVQQADDTEVEMKIYPNPGKGLFNIQLPHIDGRQVQLLVMSINGSVVNRQLIDITGGPVQTVDLNFLSNGVYIVELNDRGAKHRQKLVVR